MLALSEIEMIVPFKNFSYHVWIFLLEPGGERACSLRRADPGAAGALPARSERAQSFSRVTTEPGQWLRSFPGGSGSCQVPWMAQSHAGPGEALEAAEVVAGGGTQHHRRLEVLPLLPRWPPALLH